MLRALCQRSPPDGAAACKRLQATLAHSRLDFGIRHRTLSSATRDSFQLINRSKANDDVGSALHTKVDSFLRKGMVLHEKWYRSRVPRKEERFIRPLANQVSPFHYVNSQHHAGIRYGISRSGLRALRTICERRVASGMQYRTFSDTVNSKLPTFERAGLKVAKEFVENGETIKDDVKWKRAKEYDALANEIVELHWELQAALETKKDTDRVHHLGHGVYVQHNKYGIDRDA